MFPLFTPALERKEHIVSGNRHDVLLPNGDTQNTQGTSRASSSDVFVSSLRPSRRPPETIIALAQER